MDLSGNNNNGIIDDSAGIQVFDGTNMTDTELYLNGQSVVLGTRNTKITFNVALNRINHTVFNLCKYRDGATWRGRILQTDQDNGLFGFHAAKSGVAYENYWIVEQSRDDGYEPVDRFGDSWVISSQIHHLYRGNFKDLTAQNPWWNSANFHFTNKLMINQGSYPNDYSDFAWVKLL